MNPTTLTLLITVLTPSLIAGLKILLPKLPKVLLPLLCPLLGVLIDLVAQQTTGTDLGNTGTAALFGALGLFLREVYDQVAKWLTGQAKVIPILFILGILTATLGLGCAVGAKRLEPGGAYAPVAVVTTVETNADGTVTSVTTTNLVQLPDYEFFAVESSFRLAYAAIDIVYALERDNRALLWRASPEIKLGLDAVRPEVERAVKDYLRAREAYAAAPTPAGLSVMESFLARLNQLRVSVEALSPTKQRTLNNQH